jgi:lipid II:glycine glycyltransferase (peptidoglycan interpeptide bridge formation enzyme)
MTRTRPPGETACGSVTVRSVADPGSGDVAAWDRLVTATPGTDVTQLSVWARVRAGAGFSPVHLFARRDGLLVGGVQVLVRRVPGLGRIGYASYGPLLPAAPGDREQAVGALSLGLARLPGLRALFVQPAEGTDEVRAALLGLGFRPSTAGIAPVGSVRLDVQRSDDEIAKAFPPRLRSWTRRWPDAGVTVRRGTEDDVATLTALQRAAADSQGYSRPPRAEYVRRMYAELARTGHAALFVGEVHGVPVSADLVTMCGTTVRGRLSGFDRSGPGGRLSVPGAVRWEVIRWARREGYRWLDFGGLSEQTLREVVDGGPRAADRPGPDSAKLQFGGEAFRYPGPVERIGPAPLRAAYDVAKGSDWGRARLREVQVLLRSRPAGRREPGEAGGRTNP